MQHDKRIQILSEAEIEAIYDYPIFLPEDQLYFFELDENLLASLKLLKTTEVKIHFILMLGYFKAKSIFYQINPDKSKNDIAYLMKRFFPNQTFKAKKLSKNSTTKIKHFIKTYFQIGSAKQQKNKIHKKLRALARLNIIPTQLVKAFLNDLYSEKIPIPAYSTLQTLIGETITREENRLSRIIAKYMTKRIDQSIERLLSVDHGIYQISALKADAKSFKTNDAKGELEKSQMIHKIFNFSKILLPKLKISGVNKNYYASLAVYYDAYKLRKLPKRKYQLYLICFANEQFYKISNNIIDTFVHYVRLYDKKSEEVAMKNIAKAKLTLEAQQQKVAGILGLFDDNRLNDHQFKFVKKKAFKKMPLDEMRSTQQLFKKGTLDKKAFIWQFHDKNHQCTALNLRPLFMEIDFSCAKSSAHLKKAMDFMRAAFKAKKPLAKFKPEVIPIQFIEHKIKKYIIHTAQDAEDINNTKNTNKTNNEKNTRKPHITAHRYEYYIYQQLEKGLRCGTAFSNYSVEYKSLESDLQLKEKSKDYEKFIRASEILLIKNDIRKTLDEQKEILETLIEHVNQRIISGENKYIKTKIVKGQTKIIVPYEKIEGEFNDPFFDDHEQIHLVDLLVFVDQRCHYSQEFLHLKQYQSKKSYDYQYLLACILANATGLGIHKIAESSNLNYDKLKNIHQSRVRLETLKQANKIICHAMAKLPIFEKYHVNNKIHGSNDGQKFDVRWETFKSRYLRKYFKEKGTSAYSMIINNIAVDSKIITGHESHYLFDMIFNNTTHIRPDIISTDTEGSNQVNFLFLELIGVAFAPRYKSIGKKLKTICGFHHPKYYRDKHYVINPAKKINEELIIKEWQNSLNIFAALLSGDTAQSIIVKKLSSRDHHSDTKKALWEFNNILNSIYLLLYIDNLEFQRGIKKVLNRGEGYHQLRRAIANVGGGDFRGKNEMEIIIWNECARLVANSIIYYNAYLLSSILEAKEKIGDQEAIELLKRISPIAWQHINLLGMYDFSLNNSINIDRVLSAMLKNFDNEWVKTKRKNRE